MVGPDGRDYGNGVDVSGGDQLMNVLGHTYRRVGFLEALQSLRALVAHSHHANTVQAMEVPDDVGPPIPIAHHTDAQQAVG